MDKMRHPIKEILKGISERLSADFSEDEDLIEGYLLIFIQRFFVEIIWMLRQMNIC